MKTLWPYLRAMPCPCSSVRLSALICSVVVLFALALQAQSAMAKDHADVLITGGTVVTMDGSRRILEGGAIAVRGDTIVGVGTLAEMEARVEAAKRIDATGMIVMPGLINGHQHAAMTLFRGLADDLALNDWLEKYIFPAEAKNVTEDFVVWGTRLGILEMLRGGTTTYADMYYFEDAVARVTKEAGMRGVLAETIIDFPAPDNKTTAQAFAYTEDFSETLERRSADHCFGRPSFDLYVFRENVAGIGGPGAPLSRADPDSSFGSAF